VRVQAAAGKPTSAICHGYVATSLLTTDSIKVAVSGSPSGTCAYNVHVLEFDNVRATNAVDGLNGAASTSTSGIANSGSITLNSAEAVVGVVAWNDNAGIVGNGAGWVNFYDPVSTALEGVTEYIVTYASPQAASSTDDNSKNWSAAVVGYLPELTPTPTP